MSFLFTENLFDYFVLQMMQINGHAKKMLYFIMHM